MKRRRMIENSLEQANLRTAEAPSLPRLGDLFLPAVLLERICWPEGLLDRILQRCGRLLSDSARTPAVERPGALNPLGKRAGSADPATERARAKEGEG